MILRVRGASASGTSPSSLTVSFILPLQELHVAGQAEEALAAVERERLAGKSRRCNDEAQGGDDLLDPDAAAERVHAVHRVEIGAALRARDQGDRWRDAAHPEAAPGIMAGEQFGQP